MGWLEKWDARNQRIVDRANDRFKREGFPPDSPGPIWAYLISLIPGLGPIGIAVIARAAWKQRRARSKAAPATSRPNVDETGQSVPPHSSS
jgi:hypothetical protein